MASPRLIRRFAYTRASLGRRRWTVITTAQSFRNSGGLSPVKTVFRVEMTGTKPEFGGNVGYLNFVGNRFDLRVIVLPACWFTTEHFGILKA